MKPLRGADGSICQSSQFVNDIHTHANILKFRLFSYSSEVLADNKHADRRSRSSGH